MSDINNLLVIKILKETFLDAYLLTLASKKCLKKFLAVYIDS